MPASRGNREPQGDTVAVVVEVDPGSPEGRYRPSRLGPKARRTRAAILAAARSVFEAEGYRRTTVAMIAEAAGTSVATFYQYFRDRADVMAQLVEGPLATALDGGVHLWRAADGRAGVRAFVGTFIGAYASDRFAAVWEEAASTDEQLAEVRRHLSRLITDAVEAELRSAAAAGLVDEGLDPAVLAPALAAMVDRYCFVTYAFDRRPEPPSASHAADVLAEVWCRAIGLRDPAGKDLAR